EIGHLRLGRGDACTIGLREQRGRDERDEQPDDGDHHQHFDQGHAGPGAVAIAFGECRHICTSLMLVIASSMLRISEPISTPITKITTGSKMEVKRLMEARVSVS